MRLVERSFHESQYTMSRTSFPYYIPHQRELSREELRLLDFLLPRVDCIKTRATDLKVVGRCGCGKCPTILFGKSLDDHPIPSAGVVASWSGRADNGTLVGILLSERDGFPTELEAVSEDGGEIRSWPPIDEIR